METIMDWLISYPEKAAERSDPRAVVLYEPMKMIPRSVSAFSSRSN